MVNYCLWCERKHREGTKVKMKHEKILMKITNGETPCNFGQCKPYLCSHFYEIISLGVKTVGNCNECLSILNQINHQRELLLNYKKEK